MYAAAGWSWKRRKDTELRNHSASTTHAPPPPCRGRGSARPPDRHRRHARSRRPAARCPRRRRHARGRAAPVRQLGGIAWPGQPRHAVERTERSARGAAHVRGPADRRFDATMRFHGQQVAAAPPRQRSSSAAWSLQPSTRMRRTRPRRHSPGDARRQGRAAGAGPACVASFFTGFSRRCHGEAVPEIGPERARCSEERAVAGRCRAAPRRGACFRCRTVPDRQVRDEPLRRFTSGDAESVGAAAPFDTAARAMVGLARRCDSTIARRLSSVYRVALVERWVSNPRYGETVNQISSLAHSTTLPPLRSGASAGLLPRAGF